MDNRLLELLVCPVCRSPLQLLRDEGQRPHELTCAADRLAFPIRDGLPCMLETEARSLDATPATAEASAPAAPSGS